MRLVQVLAAAAVAGCSPGQDAAMSTSIQDVRARYLEELMARNGVVSVGIGEDSAGNPVIVVGMDRDRPDVAETLPAELEGYPVRVETVGRIRAR